MNISENTKNSFIQFLGFLLRDISDTVLTDLFEKIDDEDYEDDGFPGFDDDDLF